MKVKYEDREDMSKPKCENKECKRVGTYKCSHCGFVMCNQCEKEAYGECTECMPMMVKIKPKHPTLKTRAMNKEQKSLIFQALGEASMCWSETPKGVFDSNNAERIGNELIKALASHPIPSEEEWKEWEKEWWSPPPNNENPNPFKFIRDKLSMRDRTNPKEEGTNLKELRQKVKESGITDEDLDGMIDNPKEGEEG